MNKKACVYFHQGWTDIILCFSLINYYKKKYDEIYVLIRSDAKNLVDFYIRNMKNVKIIYMDTDNGRYYGNIETNSKNDTVEYFGSLITVPENFDIMFHAEHDKWRKDNYKNYWYQPDFNKKAASHFSEMFYIFYDIDFITRVIDFSLDRDLELEDKTYKDFSEKYGTEYVIYHDDNNNHIHGTHHVSTEIQFENKLENHSYVNLNKLSSVFFDYIKVIQNAKEIHLVDSIWAAICYQLDAKYGLFSNKVINVYCKRDHQNMFLHPVKLENWKLI